MKNIINSSFLYLIPNKILNIKVNGKNNCTMIAWISGGTLVVALTYIIDITQIDHKKPMNNIFLWSLQLIQNFFLLNIKYANGYNNIDTILLYNNTKYNSLSF
jgi:hypothetical protein